jgi:polysaccharide pyruvyl transferase WcaK-like protein
MKIVIHGYYGKKNTGDELILQVIDKFIYQLSTEYSIDAYVLPALNTRGTYRPNINTLKVLQYHKNRYLSRMGIFNSATDTDLLIIGGGGIIQDHEDNKSGPIRSLLKRALFVRIFGGRVVLLGIGASRLVTVLGKFQTRLLCAMSDFITARDRETVRQLTRVGVSPDKIHVTGDLVPLWEPKKTTARNYKSEKETFHIVVSILPYHLEKMESAEKTQHFRRQLASALDFILQKTKGTLAFLCFQGDPPGYDKSEAEAVMNFLKYKKCCRIMDYDDQPERIYHEIKGAQLMIGMRLHSIVLACMAGLPFIAIAYHQKVASFAKSVNAEQWIVSRDQVRDGYLKDKANAVIHHIATRHQNELASLRKSARQNFKILRRYLLHLSDRH